MIAICVAAVATSSLLGCGGSGDTATTQQPQVDPRFATAEALLDYFDSLDESEPAHLRALVELYYAENPLQEQHVRMHSYVATTGETQQALHEQFGDEAMDRYFEEQFGGPLPEPPLPNNQLKQPARITQHSGERAVATYVDPFGFERTLHIVKIGGRWWISGYTLEYESALEEQMIDRIEETMRRRTEVSTLLLLRLRAGEFNSPGEYFLELRRLLEP